MNFLKNALISIGYMVGIIAISTFLLTILNYFDIIGKSMLSIFKILVALISLFVGGFLIGKKSKQKGWLEGLKVSLIFIVILILFNILGLSQKIELKNILYYLILIISCMFGGMIGINKKNQEWFFFWIILISI